MFQQCHQGLKNPSQFRLVTGVSKFTGESKPDTWLEDYRVAMQIGGGNDQVGMKHLHFDVGRVSQSLVESVGPWQHIKLGRVGPSVC